MFRNNNYYIKVLMLTATLTCITAVSLDAGAARKESEKLREASVYIVKDGDYLGGIAMANGVSITDLIEANGLDDPDKIYSGMELMIPGAPMHTGENESPKSEKAPARKIYVEVPKGFTLTRIAKVYGVSVSAIVKANSNLDNPDNLQAGARILIPGATEEIELVPPPPCYNPAVEFYRIKSDETEKIHLTFCNGKPNPAGVDKLSHFTSPLNLKKMPFPLHPRLAVLLQKVADHFPGRRLEVVSGQRLQKRKNHESFHTKGQAIDFRVAGIPNRTLVNFVREFEDTGVGFYPNSVFVHLDTRKRNAFWIDYSRPGERAIYARAGMTQEDVERIRTTRQTRKIVGKSRGLKARFWKKQQPNNEPDVTEIHQNHSEAEAANSANNPTRNDEVASESDNVAADRTDTPKEIAALQGSGQV